MNTNLERRKTPAFRCTSPAAITSGITRGICRWLAEHSFAVLTEFRLGNGQRADVVGLSLSGNIIIVEVKSTVPDFRADKKWLEYVPYCNAFSFAVPKEFPREILPKSCGILVADQYGAVIERPASVQKLNSSRRRALTLRFAHTAGRRLLEKIDPGL